MDSQKLHVSALDHFVLRVRNVDKTVAFYRDLLGLPFEFLDEYRAGMRPFVSARVGAQLIDFVPDPNHDPETALRAGGFMHLCVRLQRPPIREAIAWLRERGVEVIEAQPVPRMGATGIGLSAYIRDPDGYIVELKEEV